MMDDLSSFFKIIAEEKKKQEDEFKSLVGEDISTIIENIFVSEKVEKKDKKKKVKKVSSTPINDARTVLTDTGITNSVALENDNLNQYVKFLQASSNSTSSNQLVEQVQNKEFEQLKKLVYEIARDVKIQGGGGEVNLAYMDLPITSVTSSSYTITLNDYYIGVNYAGAVTLTLPKADREGKVFIVKDELGEASKGTNRYITILPSGTDLIDGRDKAILAFDYGSLTFIWKDNSWRVV